MKETKIEIPAGCEVEKVETQDGHVVVTFKELKPKLPKSWEEFCEMFPDYTGNWFIELNNDEKIGQVQGISEHEKRTYRNAELLPDRATAEAVLALCQIIQLRNAYNGAWVPDWTSDDTKEKYVIEFFHTLALASRRFDYPEILHFKTAELRDEFLRNFRPLVEKLKPLYGIKEGGEE